MGLEPSEEIRRWYAAIPCCIQRSNAKVLTHTAAIALRRDGPGLGLCSVIFSLGEESVGYVVVGNDNVYDP